MGKKTTKNSWKSSRVDNAVVPGLYPSKTGTMRFRPMAGLVGCGFYLILVYTCSWPQTDKVYLSLVTALSKLLDLKKIGKLVGKMMKSYFSKFRQNRKAVKI